MIHYEAYPDTRFKPCADKKIWIVTATEVDGDIPLGGCNFVKDKNFSRITSLYVYPKWRNVGIGRRLITFALEKLSKGEKDVYVEADSFELNQGEGPTIHLDNEELREFYMKLGFEPVEGHPFSLVLKRKEGESCT
jgi:GNAT superfamily N-acetyltransferase